jgi:predicted secreted protein
MHSFRDVILPQLIPYHHHVPNNVIAHTAIAPAQNPAQTESIIRITNHTHVCDATAQLRGKQRMVKVRLDPEGGGVMPAAGSGKYATHN